MTDRIAAALEDVERLKTGWRPAEAALGAAPYIDAWLVAAHPNDGEISLVGTVTDHPSANVGKLGKTTWTSPLMWIDVEAKIARTVSRWYELGTPHPAMERLAEEDGESTPKGMAFS